MKYFVFRNNTIERFFPNDYQFSGYDDISSMPNEAENYVWYYQAPIKYNQKVLFDEISGYIEKLGFLLSHIDKNKTFIIITMDCLYSVSLTDDDCRLQTAIAQYNLALYNFERQYPNVKVIDITEFTRRYAVADLIDWKYYFISQMGMNPRLSKAFSIWWEKKLDSIALKRKKCVVLDLDNTLWGGVLGEDGINGIKIGGDYPGKAFFYFQEALLELSRHGVILTICSKNNEQDVLEAWEKNPFIVLRKEHFVAYRINWIDKATNIRELADELNIGLDSFVFVDDNPTERELIKQVLPMVAVPDFPEQPYELPIFFRRMVEDYFEVYTITDEDKMKTEQYKANAARIQAQHSFADFRAFLESLDIRIEVETANEFNIQRIAQMTQKTNQFNLTTHRYTDSDIKMFMAEGWKVWCINVADRFGNHGITGCIIVKPSNSTDICEIDSLLLSCRILGKGIELAFIKCVLLRLREIGFSVVNAKYIPTAKNVQVNDFYERCGFACKVENEDGTKEYELALYDADLKIEDYYHINLQ